MPWDNRQRVRMLACALLVAIAGVAQAQTPQQTTATYGDWVVRCETPAGTAAKKTCEMVQYTQMQGQAGVISQVAVGHPVKGQPIKLVIQVPNGVWLPSGAKLVAVASDPGLLATFKRCLPAGCFADIEVKDDVIRKFRTMTEPGKIQFKDGSLKDVSLPVSFKGFGTAFDALAKE